MQFPKDVLEAAIRDEIVAAAKDRPPTKSGWRPEVDSQVVIRIVLRIEAEIGVELPEDAMPPGGFDDVEQCVATLLGTSQRLWRERVQQKGEPVS